jgi:hypothetical protein
MLQVSSVFPVANKWSLHFIFLFWTLKMSDIISNDIKNIAYFTVNMEESSQ